MALEVDELCSGLTRRAGGLAPAGAPAALAASPAAPKKEKEPKKEKVAKEKPTWGEPGKGKEKKEKAKTKVVEEEIQETPHGEKKDMTRVMAAAYNPRL